MLQNFVSEIFEGKELQKEPLLFSRIKVIYVKAIDLKFSDFWYLPLEKWRYIETEDKLADKPNKVSSAKTYSSV